MKNQVGLTLIELLVTIAIVAILASLAVPSFTQMIANNALSSQLNSFNTDTRFARSEAVKRGIDVVLCTSTNPMVASPTCSGLGDWKTGWIVFVNTDSNSTRSTDPADGEIVLRRQEAYANSRSIIGTSTVASIRYNADGRVPGGATNLTFTALDDINNSRTICIAMTGRVRILDKGMSPPCP